MAKVVRCPKCRSERIQILGEKKRGFSTRKAIGGMLLAGNRGWLAGFLGKEPTYDLRCSDCGYRFRLK